MTTRPSEVTRDAFLDGRVQLWQPARGYRAGVDAVFLAAACPASPGQTVLELGCGAGAAALCLAARVPRLHLIGVEREPEMARFALCNARAMGAPMRVVRADIAALPPSLRQQRFDHVIANPPYFSREGTSPSAEPLREAAKSEDTPLTTWIEVASRRLAPKGTLTLIHRAERLDDLLVALHGKLGSIALQPLAPRTARPANTVILRAQKGGRATLTLHAPLIVHIGERHLRDGESYTDDVSSVLRDGESLPGFRA